MDAYLDAAGIRNDKTTPLFARRTRKTGTLTENRMSQSDALEHAAAAGEEGRHHHLENGGAIEMAQYMAGHADPRTTKHYDRRCRVVTRSGQSGQL